jgi:hypothetical protein
MCKIKYVAGSVLSHGCRVRVSPMYSVLVLLLMDVSQIVQRCACDAYWSLENNISVFLVDSDSLLHKCWCEGRRQLLLPQTIGASAWLPPPVMQWPGGAGK